MSGPVLDTPRLRLRPLVAEDDAFVLELLNEPGWLAHIGDRGVRSLAEARRYIADGPTAMIARHGFGLLAVTLRDSGEPVGICGLLKRESLPDPDLGYALLARHTGRGYAREAAASVLAWARREGGCGRILAITSRGNAASVAVLEALGFRPGGRRRMPGEAEDVDVFVHGPEEGR
ncbi:MAG: GNAT family N-acetyltransferase [Holophagaceae bacterium]